jgi:ubiquinone/menaquinone biosynthesis C-methylase UbiE
MPEYLESSFDLSDEKTVSIIDELSLWSAPFGLMLLDHITMKPGMKVLDVGFGTGFPLLELAQRLGNSCTVYGIDPWQEAIERAKLKIEVLDIKNVRLVEGDAAAMEFDSKMFDLIVSNVGINNFENPAKVLEECFRVAKPGARIALTTNPVGHMNEFYTVYQETLKELGLERFMEELAAQENHRLSVGKIGRLLQDAGFRITASHQRVNVMRFGDGNAFFNHGLIRMGFIEGWKGIVPTEEQPRVFERLEEKLNALTRLHNELRLTIPILYIEGERAEVT